MAVTFNEFTFPSASGCNTLVGGVWQDDAKKPAAVVQLSHGMCEYIGRYDDFARYLVSCGYAVIGHDHLGHGKSAKTADELGYFAKKDGYKLVVEDVHTVTKMANELFPDTPVFLFGHSMGSFIATAYVAKYGSLLKGAVISGTGGPNPILGIAVFITDITKLFRGERHRSKFIDNLGFGSYCKKIENPNTPKDWLTRDTAIVDKYVRDPFCTYLFTASAFRDLFKMLGAATDKKLPASVPSDLPLFYIAGKDDPVGNYGEGPTIMAERMKAAGKNATLRLYDDMRHECHNELGHEGVYKDIADFVANNLK